MSQNRENYDLGRDPNDVDIFKKKNNEYAVSSPNVPITRNIDGFEFINKSVYLEIVKIKDKEIAELISVSNANIDLATKYIHEIAERDAEIEKLTFERDTNIKFGKLMIVAQNKRDKLLERANSQFLCFKSITEQELIHIKASLIGSVVFAGMVEKIEQWLSDYEALKGDGK